MCHAFEEKKTWHYARESCRSLGADLVSIVSMTEQSWLESWSNGHMVTFTYWDLGEPTNHDGFNEDCVKMSEALMCQGWDAYEYSCYWMEETARSWSDAKDFCKGQDSVLVHVGDLRDLMLPTWIGLSDLLAENQYAWSDGVSPVLYTNWNDKEPNNAEGTEHCVAMAHNHLVTGKWNDDACHKAHSFVCSRIKASSIAPPPPTKSPCPDGYISWYHNCYKLVEQPATWDAAQAACVQEGGNLASIDMSYDQAFLAGAVLNGMDSWIGLRRKDDGSYTWTDGWPVFFTQWGPGEPSNINDEGCVAIHGGRVFHGTWNDTKCDLAKPYICKISSESPPPTPAPGNGMCLPFWYPYGRYCYHVYNGQQGFSWPESRHYCQSIRGDLASLHSRAEVEFVRNLNYTKYHNIWIGLTRDSNFGWAWTDKTSLGFLNWAHGEPNAAFHPGNAADENCVEMYPDGLWNDNNCLQKRGFVCRHHQYHTTDDNGNPVFPTPGPGGPNNGGVIAGAIIAAVLVFTLVAGLLYYLLGVRGYKLSGLSLPTRAANRVDVPAFTNPNFGGESDT